MTHSKNLNTTYCYVRAVRPAKIGHHSIACIALAATEDPTKVRVAWSVCNHKDNFSKKLGVKKAVSRLNSDKLSRVVDRNVNSIMNDSGLTETLMRVRHSDESLSAETAVQGALGDLAVGVQA